MVQGQKFRQQWEFRRRDNFFDSSSNAPKSSSCGMPVIKKHKIVPNLIPPKTDEAEDISRFQRKDRYTSRMGGHVRIEKSNKRKFGSNGKEDVVLYSETRMGVLHREDNRKKSKSSAYMPATLDSTRVLMESILEELKVARENMFTWMREEMHKVMSDNTTPGPTRRDDDDSVQHQERLERGSNVKNCNGGTLVGSVKHRRTINSRNGYEVLGNQAAHCQPNPSLTSMEKDREMLSSSIKGSSSSSFSVGPSDQVGSSMYLTLPTVLPEVFVENQRFNSPSCDYFLTRSDENRMALNIEKANPTLSSSIHPVSFPGDQKEDKFGNITHMGYQDLGYIGQNKLPLASSFGSGFPVPLSRDLDGSFRIQAQASVQNLSQFQENIFGPSMNGGMRSLREGHGLSEFATM